MFPQTELDNYKLQVELLQEKLQRSELSRQQLEHKLDKLLQKRDEHDKIARSKAKQKYQQFLEEQKRRNERNKQLVQMLERIEQQTEIMNARSERLKMMKLQYEMYFAKLVHLQTRRCVQSSVSPVVPMMATTLDQPLTQNTMFGIQKTVKDAYNYMPNANMPMMATFQRYSTTPILKKDQYNRQQTMNMPNDTLEIPTLATVPRDDKSLEINIGNVEGAAAGCYEPLYQNNVKIVHRHKQKENDEDLNYFTKMQFNTSRNLEPDTHLLPKDKELADFQDSPKLSKLTSSTVAEVPNVKMMSQIKIANNSDKFIHKIDPLNKSNLLKTSLNNENTLKQPTSPIYSVQKSTMNITENNNQRSEEVENSTYNIGKSFRGTQVELKNIPEIITEPFTSSSETGQDKTPLKTSPSSETSITNLKTKTNETPILPNVQFNINSEKSSSTKNMSIESIENAIYGELLSPIEIEQDKKQETNNIVPKIVDNLVTQAETIKAEQNFNLKENSEAKSDTLFADNNNEFEKNVNNENIKPNIAYEEYISTQQNKLLINNEGEHDTYEDIDPNTVNKNQQEQQYDYSNYDPTQFSYPGYIYDEATGEYKLDSNALEQYATDQQYAAEDYDQQYHQQNAYEYDQTYAQEPTSNLDKNSCSNYDLVLKENTSDIENPDSNLNKQNLQQPQQSESESEQQQPFEQIIPNSSTDIPQLPEKITKPTSILSTADKNENQKKKKRVNFVDSSEADESEADKEVVSKPKPISDGSNESDFDFSSSTEGETKAS